MVVAATEDVGAVLVVFVLNPTIEVIPEKIEFLDLDLLLGALPFLALIALIFSS